MATVLVTGPPHVVNGTDRHITPGQTGMPSMMLFGDFVGTIRLNRQPDFANR